VANVGAEIMRAQLSDELRDLTVVILTHNRQHCLIPAINYWQEIGVKTLIVDESPKPLKLMSSSNTHNYIHVKKPFAERCLIAASNIESKYSIMVSDDEIFTRSGLLEMVRTLDSDKSLVSVGGVAIAIWKYGPLIAGSWPYQGTFRFENFYDTAIGRIRHHTGNGKRPVSAFFTSNVNRTEYLRRCLKLYAKSPVIATEAISILTICSAGKSKFLDSLYWIRNWNEFPRSHANWDRSISLPHWWSEQKGNEIWKLFYENLSNAYLEISQSDDFEEVWNLIMQASEVIQPSANVKKYKESRILDSYGLRYLKYGMKKTLRNKSVPKKFTTVLSEMKSSGVIFDDSEVEKAIKIVKGMRPYKNWK
jgi:glycosyltransferase domain-containing protein